MTFLEAVIAVVGAIGEFIENLYDAAGPILGCAVVWFCFMFMFFFFPLVILAIVGTALMWVIFA
jgi:hypothetical protein